MRIIVYLSVLALTLTACKPVPPPAPPAPGQPPAKVVDEDTIRTEIEMGEDGTIQYDMKPTSATFFEFKLKDGTRCVGGYGRGVTCEWRK